RFPRCAAEERERREHRRVMFSFDKVESDGCLYSARWSGRKKRGGREQAWRGGRQSRAGDVRDCVSGDLRIESCRAVGGAGRATSGTSITGANYHVLHKMWCAEVR